MKSKIEQLVKELKKQRDSNRKIAMRGSPMTSMSEENAIGEVAEEQDRIIQQLEKILKEEG